jgi:nitroreductase
MLTPFADEEQVYRLLEPVQRAPSVHNTQPWWFRIVADDRIDLCARFGHHAELAMNGSGMPAVSPFLRRELFISCGAALYNLRLAIRVTGHDLVVWLLPGGPDLSVLASVEIVTGRTKRPTISEQELYEAIPRRHTNRWPYDDRHPAPPPVLAAMQSAAAGEEGWLRVLARRQGRTWLREAHDAAREQRGQGYQPDLDRWTNGGDGNSGVPAAAFGPPGTFSEDPHHRRHLGPRRDYPPIRDFRPSVRPGTGGADEAEDPGEQDGRAQAETPRFERRPQLMVLSTTRDRPLDWLRAGQALQHALLTATHSGVSASFLTQPLELHDAQSLGGGPSENPESPGPGARPRPLELPGRKADSGLQPLPGATGDSGSRRLPWPWPYAEYPQMVLRVGYAAHEAVITARQDPVVLDSRTGRWMRHSSPILAAA